MLKGLRFNFSSLLTFLVFITSYVLYFLGHLFVSNNISPSVFYFYFAHFLISDDFCSCPLLKIMKLISFLTCTSSFPSLAWLEFWPQLGHLPLPSLYCRMLPVQCLDVCESASCCPTALLNCSSGLLHWLLNSGPHIFPLFSFQLCGDTRMLYKRQRFAYVTILLKHCGLPTASRMKPRLPRVTFETLLTQH